MGIKAILVDDEWLALQSLEKLLTEYDDIDLIGSYMNPLEALEQINLQQPDVVFLDIGMPDLNGLLAAEQIQEAAPSAAVVFTTGHANYTHEAFELNVIDYLMKPVRHERFMKTLLRLRQHFGLIQKANPSPAAPMMFHCMGTMQLQAGNRPPEKLTWRTSKIKELFAYLFHYRGRVVSKEVLLELLWPDLNERNGLSNLQTSIYRIRQQLDKFHSLHQDALQSESCIKIEYTSFGYVMELGQARIDIYEWEREIEAKKPVSMLNAARYTQLIEAYKADYFGEDDYSWAENERQRIKAIWLRHVLTVGQFYTGEGMLAEALRIYHKAQQLDPFLPEVCLALMKLYDKLNDRASVASQFHSYRNQLLREFSIQPNDEISAWYKEWSSR